MPLKLRWGGFFNGVTRGQYRSPMLSPPHSCIVVILSYRAVKKKVLFTALSKWRWKMQEDFDSFSEKILSHSMLMMRKVTQKSIQEQILG